MFKNPAGDDLIQQGAPDGLAAFAATVLAAFKQVDQIRRRRHLKMTFGRNFLEVRQVDGNFLAAVSGMIKDFATNAALAGLQVQIFVDFPELFEHGVITAESALPGSAAIPDMIDGKVDHRIINMTAEDQR